MDQPTKWPTRKWFATQVTALGALAVMWITTGQFGQSEQIAAVGVLVQASVAYLIPNAAPKEEEPPVE